LIEEIDNNNSIQFLGCRSNDLIVSQVKEYFSKIGYIVDDSTGRGVESNFRIKKGPTKRDPVSIIDVMDKFVEIKISQITNEKRYVFRVEGMFFITTGRTLEKYLDGKFISATTIKRFKRINVLEIIFPHNALNNPIHSSRLDVVTSFELHDLKISNVSFIRIFQTCSTCQAI
jgi:hypothetical protein